MSIISDWMFGLKHADLLPVYCHDCVVSCVTPLSPPRCSDFLRHESMSCEFSLHVHVSILFSIADTAVDGFDTVVMISFESRPLRYLSAVFTVHCSGPIACISIIHDSPSIFKCRA